MTRGMFVSLSEIYSDLSEQGRKRGAAGLRNATCVAWFVNPANADDVSFVFGVESGRVVSAYRVTHPATEWPTIPFGALGANRKCIPVADLSEEDWATACSWPGVQMFGPLRYCQVVRSTSGALLSFAFESGDRCEDERSESAAEDAKGDVR